MFQALLMMSMLLCGANAASYSSHSVKSCIPNNRQQLDVLHGLEDNAELHVDVWKEARRVGTSVDIMVSADNMNKFNTLMISNEIECHTKIENVQEIIDDMKNKRKNINLNSVSSTSYFNDYHTSDEVHAYINQLATDYPKLAKTSIIGKTYGNKDMQLITISTAPNTNKKALWFDGGLHAREWITVATVTYLADQLIRGYGNNANATYVLDNFDILIAPILNVDGYDYTWDDNGDRMWRKTRSPNGANPCVGTDPNRNWVFHWGEAGTSTQKCSESYEGAYAASEVEVQHIQKYLYDHKDTLRGYINFHSYSQEWMSPWGYTDALPKDYIKQNALSERATSAIAATHGKQYVYGPIATTIYPASGSSADYTYGVCGITYSYGVELRDTGRYGFLLPPDEIIPQGEEIFNAIVAMSQYINENP